MTVAGARNARGVDALTRVRAICRALPEVIETTTFGHPTFQAGKTRTFAVLDDAERAGSLCLVVKLGLDEQEALVDDERVFRCKFGARHGWTSIKVDGKTNWRLARELIETSYRRVATKKMLAKL
jgi:predicted DNA-binding protein (MmcQ/YjbR family)